MVYVGGACPPPEELEAKSGDGDAEITV